MVLSAIAELLFSYCYRVSPGNGKHCNFLVYDPNKHRRSIFLANSQTGRRSLFIWKFNNDLSMSVLTAYCCKVQLPLETCCFAVFFQNILEIGIQLDKNYPTSSSQATVLRCMWFDFCCALFTALHLCFSLPLMVHEAISV